MKYKFVMQSVLALMVLNSCSITLPSSTSTLSPFTIQMPQQHFQISSQRFTRSSQGIIADTKTGLEWLEGPDVPTSWEMAEQWVASLDKGWRLPSTKELHGLYLENSTRKGKYGDPLCLDKAFLRESGYSLWSVKRSSNSAWMYDFSRGYYHWTETVVKGHFDRAIAVRAKTIQ